MENQKRPWNAHTVHASSSQKPSFASPLLPSKSRLSRKRVVCSLLFSCSSPSSCALSCPVSFSPFSRNGKKVLAADCPGPWPTRPLRPASFRVEATGTLTVPELGPSHVLTSQTSRNRSLPARGAEAAGRSWHRRVAPPYHRVPLLLWSSCLSPLAFLSLPVSLSPVSPCPSPYPSINNRITDLARVASVQDAVDVGVGGSMHAVIPSRLALSSFFASPC